MYVRDAKNRDEAWLLDHIEAMGLDDAAFRSRDYVIAVDEETNEKAGFGRIRIHKSEEGDYCELTGLGVLDRWRGQGVGAHIIERLVENAGDEGFNTLYSFVDAADYLGQFGFEEIDEDELPGPLVDRLEAKRSDVFPEAVPMVLAAEAFTMPQRLREAFKAAGAAEQEVEPEPEETAEDFGIDPETATYKYDTGR